MFKPLTKKPAEPKNELTATETAAEKEAAIKRAAALAPQTREQVIETTEERIYLVFDDSGSMESLVPNSGNPGESDKSRLQLAFEATTDYLKNCKPYVTAVEIGLLNGPKFELTKNLPKLATDLIRVGKETELGGTPLFRATHKIVAEHKLTKFSRALIFTDGEPTDDYYFSQNPNMFTELSELGIPIDLIIIGEPRGRLHANMQELKRVVEQSGGTFLICKDGKAFKDKMKYFAPLLRHRLAAVASEDSYK